MADPLQALLAAGAVPTTNFAPTSRYANSGVAMHERGDGSASVPYLRRRFCPGSERLSLIARVRIAGGDRRDLLAAAHLGDPELWWRLADANDAIDPRSLTASPGAFVRVAWPEGIPGGSDG